MILLLLPPISIHQLHLPATPSPPWSPWSTGQWLACAWSLDHRPQQVDPTAISDHLQDEEICNSFERKSIMKFLLVATWPLTTTFMSKPSVIWPMIIPGSNPTELDNNQTITQTVTQTVTQTITQTLTQTLTLHYRHYNTLQTDKVQTVKTDQC